MPPPLQFDPEHWASSPDLQARVTASLAADDFESALTAAFDLPGPPDPYVYRAIAAVTLPQAQRAVSLGRANGLHRWYLKDDDGSGSGSAGANVDAIDAGNPTPADVDAYTAVFAAGASPAKALTALGSNAKRGSLRAAVAAHLVEKRWLDVEGGLDGVAPSRWRPGGAGAGGAGGGGGGGSGSSKKKKKKKKAKGKGTNGPEATTITAGITGQQQEKEEKEEKKEESLAKTAAPTENAQQLVSAPRQQQQHQHQQQQQHFNPALEFWAWSCRALEWGGPCAASTRSHIAHPTLPLFMHHFGCVAPSWEALEVIRLVVERRQRRQRRKKQRQQQRQQTSDAGRTGTEAGEEGSDDGSDDGHSDGDEHADAAPAVLDVGSGNGYWAWQLRRHGVRVRAVDSGQSVFRANWIGDTERDEGARWLRRQGSGGSGGVGGGGGGGEGDVLLLVYPVVGGDFTRSMLREYRGADVVVAGTQNGNGYTGFADMTMEQFMLRERPGWRKTAQIALPSFAGKDEALFVFRSD